MSCLFCDIANKKVNSTIVYEDEKVVAFNDINPRAPTHVLVIPKKHIATINDANTEDEGLLGHIILTAQKIAKQHGFAEDGYRLVYNVNKGAGQVIYHIHLHLLGGRALTWPPG